MTLGNPRAIRQVPPGHEHRRGEHDPHETRQRQARPRRELEHQLVGAELDGSGGQGDPESRPRRLDVRGVVAAADRGGEARVVDPPSGVGERGHRQQHRGHDAPEDPAPRQVRREPGRDGRAEQRREHPGRRHVREQPRPDRLRVDPPGDDVEHDDEQAAAEAGERAPGEEERERRGAAAHGRADGEQELAGDGPDHGAGAVGPDPGEDDPEQLGGQHDGEREAVGPHGVEVAGHRRHGRRDRHRLERDDRHEGEDGDRDLEVRAAEGACLPGHRHRTPPAPLSSLRGYSQGRAGAVRPEGGVDAGARERLRREASRGVRARRGRRAGRRCGR